MSNIAMRRIEFKPHKMHEDKARPVEGWFHQFYVDADSDLCVIIEDNEGLVRTLCLYYGELRFVSPPIV